MRRRLRTKPRLARPAPLKPGTLAGDEMVRVALHLDRFSGLGGVPIGGARVDLDPWLIVRDAPFNSVLAALQAASFPCRVLSQPDFDRTLISFPSGVDLGFTGALATDARLSFVSRARRTP